MSMIVQANMPMINAQRNYKVNTGNRAKSTEKLSSGYKINRAADDAAGLTISEKMRKQIRGLNRGSLNGQDGVSWVQTGDGALEEVHAMLHRMKELTVQSLNDTNTEADRAALQAELDAIQSEIDRITDTTQFNTKNIFSEHEPTYYQFEGNVVWNQSQLHVIDAGENDLTIKYMMDGTSGEEEVTITVPAGVYTTQELTDEIEDALIAAGANEKGIYVEYTDEGNFNVNLEGGEKIESVTGELAYLLYDTYEGGSAGALIGTTPFRYENTKLAIYDDNNNLSFDIEYFDGTKRSVDIEIPTDADGIKYSRDELIDILNQKLAGTSVEAVPSGNAIKLQSDEAIITGFKGDMFKIDGGTNPHTSVFYDNVKYGSIFMTAGSFTGGSVIPEDSRDAQHQKFKITSSNNQLTFKANGSDTPVTITIPVDATVGYTEYTLDEMVAKLNELFNDNGLELNAVINDTGSFRGIKINSLVKGSMSAVGLDSSSSAYNTLFVERVYNTPYNNPVSPYRDSKSNEDATFTGSMEFTGSNPLTIIAGTNDKFTLNIGSDSYTITLDADTYNTADAIRAEIDDKLNGTNAAAAYKGLIEVSVENGKIKLTAKADTTVKDITSQATGSTLNISASEVSGNDGYDNIFVGKTQTVQYTTVSGTDSITLNTPITDPATITDADKNLTVNVNGTNKVVTLPTGTNVTHDQIIEAINNQLRSETITTDNTFQDVEAEGETTSHDFDDSDTGTTSYTSKSYSDAGYSTPVEGDPSAFATNEPAKVTMSVALPENMVIDSSNNLLQITINDEERMITLTNGTYTSRTALVNMIQNKINSEFTTGIGGAVVSLNGSNQLVFTARINNQTDGAETNISFSADTSTFIKALHTNEYAASVTTNNMLSSITIDENSNQFSFNYVEDGVAKTANITLDKNTYTRSQFINMLNNKLDAAGVNVTASLSGNAIKLTTDKKGDGNDISIDSDTIGNSVEAIFGPMVTETPASATANQEIQDNITIVENDSDEFKVSVNGTDYTLKLDPKTYTSRSEFVSMLNDKLQEANTGLKAELDGNKIKYTTEEVGDDASFKVTYAGGGSAMKAIYGETTTTYPGVVASFDSNNQLVLTGTQGGTSLSVNSNSGSLVQEPEIITSNIATNRTQGYYSKNHSYIDGVDLTSSKVDGMNDTTSTLTIDQWNDELTFTYNANGTAKSVSVTLTQKDYTFDELKTALQDAIDAQAGADQLTVTVSSSGVRIEANNAGNAYYMNSFSGDFYYKVISGIKETSSNQGVSTANGTAPADTAYTVGRKDVRNKAVEIKTGINDTLSLDFQYGNNTTEFTITLDPGTYQGESLKKAIQEKLNEAMVAQGFEANMIEVGIGGISTGVVGSNDANALNFKLSSSVRLPAEGTYIIDGVSGNAAFSVFYQTDGELIPAYVKGAKDLSNGVTIEDGENELSFDVDGSTYTISLEAKEYTSEELIDEINSQLNGQSAPVVAELEDGVLKLSHVKLGEHKITNIVGSGKQVLFFRENGEIGEEEDIKIQLSSQVGDYITIDRPVVNTVSLGINSIAITAPKYANKALERIDQALAMVSSIRSDFGASQNRLEHAIANNKNNAENTQASESRIRDVDMAEEMVAYSKHSILMQAGEAVIAQGMSDAEGVLRLLQP